MADRWVERWDVPSNSNSDRSYVVARDGEGKYGCSCPHWKFRRKECAHIADVKGGFVAPRGEQEVRRPEIVLANVAEVTVKQDDGRIVVLTPLMPIGDTWFEATLVYDLLAAGVPWGVIKKRYTVAKKNSREKVVAYIEARGRRIYGTLSKHPGMTTYWTVPVERERGYDGHR